MRHRHTLRQHLIEQLDHVRFLKNPRSSPGLASIGLATAMKVFPQLCCAGGRKAGHAGEFSISIRLLDITADRCHLAVPNSDFFCIVRGVVGTMLIACQPAGIDGQ